MAEENKVIGENNLGYKIISSLKSGEKVKFKNKKDTAFNVKILNEDLELLDLLANIFEVKRSYILNLLLTAEIRSMFNSVPYHEQYELALLVDNKLTEIGAEHLFRGETWMHDLKEIDPNRFNPINGEKILFKRNEEEKTENE